MPDVLTSTEFASKVKGKYPQYASVPDDKLVSLILAKYPQYQKSIRPEGPQRPVPEGLQGPAPQAPFMNRLSERIGNDISAPFKAWDQMNADSRKLFQDARKRGDTLDMARAPIQAIMNQVTNATKGVASMTTPGIISRLAQKEDPANIAGDAATMLGADTGAEPLNAGATKIANAVSTAVPSFERAGRGFDHIESKMGKAPIDLGNTHQAALDALNRFDLTKLVDAPGPLKAIVARIEQRLTKLGGDTYLDQPPGINFREGRNFLTDLDYAIYDKKLPRQLKGPLKNVADNLNTSLEKAAAEQGMGPVYAASRREFARGLKVQKAAEAAGKAADYGAGYVGGSYVGHPYIGAYVGNKIGLGKRAASATADTLLRRQAMGLPGGAQ